MPICDGLKQEGSGQVDASYNTESLLTHPFICCRVLNDIVDSPHFGQNSAKAKRIANEIKPYGNLHKRRNCMEKIEG